LYSFYLYLFYFIYLFIYYFFVCGAVNVRV